MQSDSDIAGIFAIIGHLDKYSYEIGQVQGIARMIEKLKIDVKPDIEAKLKHLRQ